MKSLFFVLPALLLGLTACGAPVAAVTLPDTVQVEKTQTAETAVLYEDADGREVSPRRAALTEWRWSVADDTIAEVDPSGIVTGLRCKAPTGKFPPAARYRCPARCAALLWTITRCILTTSL